MPTLVIHGMPIGVKDHLKQLEFDLKGAVAGVKKMGVKSEQVSVFFPFDHNADGPGLGKELKCFMPGTFMKPERTPDVLDRMAKCVRDALVTFAQRRIPTCSSVEVYVERFDPTIGFANWEGG